jgi:hypothetical protein
MKLHELSLHCALYPLVSVLPVFTMSSDLAGRLPYFVLPPVRYRPGRADRHTLWDRVAGQAAASHPGRPFP